MSRNGSGTYTLPSGNPVVSGTLIEASWANTTLSDIATALTGSLSRSAEGGMLASLRLYDGTSSVPGLAWGGETTTGWYRAGAGDMRLMVTGTEVVKYLSTGVSVTGNLAVSGAITATGGVTGNAATATALQTARTIWGQSFNGTANVTGALTGVTDLTASGNGSFGGTLSVTGGSTLTGNVGIGGAATAKLTVVGDQHIRSGFGVAMYDATNSGYWALYNNGGVLTYSNGTGRMFQDSSGNLGLGVTPSAGGATNYRLLEVGAAGGASLYSGPGQSLFSTNIAWDVGTAKYKVSSVQAMQYSQENGQHIWKTAPSGTAGNPISFTQAMTLDASGNLLVGTTSVDGVGVSITKTDGTIGRVSLNKSFSGNTDGIPFRHNGTYVGGITYSNSAVAYNTSSDYRLKDITGPVTGAREFIMALKPKQGSWKTDGSKFVGFLAHEFQEVSPSSVTGEKDAVDDEGKPIYQAMQASSPETVANIVALLQELVAENESLKTRIAALEGASDGAKA